LRNARQSLDGQYSLSQTAQLGDADANGLLCLCVCECVCVCVCVMSSHAMPTYSGTLCVGQGLS
jgi:hypothetical protein